MNFATRESPTNVEDGPWPGRHLKESDRFVDERQPDWHLNARVGKQLPADWASDFYSSGFRRAAAHFAKEVIEGDNRIIPVDLAVYPIVFLYRHHFELVLKVLIVGSRKLLGEEGKKPHGHHLDKLWGVARPLVERCFENDDDDWSQNDIVTSLLAELSSLDPNGEAARYPDAKNGVRHFESLWGLHIRHFADVAERLSDYLNEIATGIQITQDERDRWEAEAMSMYGPYG